MKLTIGYNTCRRDPKLRWFIESLAEQVKPEDEIGVVVCVLDETELLDTDAWVPVIHGITKFPITLIERKPSPWQGRHRLTKDQWFAAASSRNTILCHAPDGFIAYVDDLSVLAPTWLQSVREAMAGGYVACGAYQKVNKMVVENGKLVSYEFAKDSSGKVVGLDSRLNHYSKDVSPCGGNCLFGSSVCGPVEDFLRVNGWPEDLCDGHGFEDVLMGIVMENAGSKMRYDRRMFTYESEEHHHVEPSFRREDYGVSPNDKSHAALKIAQQSQDFPNSFGPGGIRELRQRVLAGEGFPIKQHPDREWFTGKLLSEL